MTKSQPYYPVGIQDFEKIRQNNGVYVDKTALIYQMVKEGSVYFLSRPRRFGKSLLISTMKAYFEGKRELFQGLAMEQLESDWIEYPVIHIDFSKNAYPDETILNEIIDKTLAPYEALYHSHSTQDMSPGGRLNALIECAHQTTGQKVVVLIDEYDAPMLDVLDRPDQLAKHREILRGLYKPLKGCDPYLKFVFLTGITKFSQLSIFSALNNLQDISMLDQFAAICGITEEELHTQLAEHIGLLAQALDKTADECRDELKKRYDGYHFSPKSPDIYNPFSLLSAFKGKTIRNYWFESATPSFLIKVIQQYDFEPRDMEGVRAQQESFYSPTDSPDGAVPILYQTGYLTITDCELDGGFKYWYVLGIPNDEVRDGYYKALMKYYVPGSSADKDTFIFELRKSIRANDLDRMMQLIRSFIASIPYDAEKRDELHYRTLFYLIFRMVTTVDIRVEERTSVGRSDAVIQTNKAVYVFEFKLLAANNPRAALKALLQINDKGYAIPYEACGRPVYKIGASFDESIGTLGEYTVEEVK